MDSCLRCFGGSSDTTSDDRNPLIPPSVAFGDVEQDHGVIGKVVDALAALNAGKFPSQTQISQLLRYLIKSELLQEPTTLPVTGYGPFSKYGRRVLSDVRELLQALLEFGMEKNDDDLFQEFYFQLLQLDKPLVQTDGGSSLHDEIRQQCSRSTLDPEAKETPITRDEQAFDAQTFFHALGTIGKSALSSSLSRAILLELFSIARDVVAHAAADVSNLAQRVQQKAEDVGKKAAEDNDITIAKEEGGEVRMRSSLDNLKGKGKEAISEVQNAAAGLKKGWHELEHDVADETKERILERMRQAMTHMQMDPACRSAIKAILILVRKYASSINSVPSSLSEAAKTASEALAADVEEPNYPPDPYGTKKHRLTSSSDSESVLGDFQRILQRIGKGFSLDRLVSALERVVHHLVEIPVVVGDDLDKTIEAKMDDTAVAEAKPAGEGQGKKSKRKGGKKGRKTGGTPDTPTSLSPSVSQSPSLSHEGVTPKKDQDANENPLGPYFTRIGQYLDQALEEPGWAASDEGNQTLVKLFDDGVELLNVVGASLIEVGEEFGVGLEGKTKDSPRHEDIRQRFKQDLNQFMAQLESYITSIQEDRTTMRLAKSVEELKNSISMLTTERTKASRTSTGGWRKRTSGLKSWTEWLSWAIPGILSSFPKGALPIPSLEVKSGNLQGILYGLFVQGLGRGQNPVGGRLIPDHVLVREWSEVKIDVQETSEGPPISSSPSNAPGSEIQSSSRIRVYMAGIRARVEDVGYYLRYNGPVLGYEDQGRLSVAVGSGKPHDGLAFDIELEMGNETQSNDISDSGDTDLTEEDNSLQSVDRDPPANMDVQRIIATQGSTPAGHDKARPSSTISEPIFGVSKVKVSMRGGLHLRLDQSCHWILNKLFVQPFGGPVLASMIQQSLERSIKERLERVSDGLGKIVLDAAKRGDARRAEARRSHLDSRQFNDTQPIDKGDIEDDGLLGVIGDWWGAVLSFGSTLVGRPTEQQGRRLSTAETVSSEDATLLQTSTTIKSQEPRKRSPMVYRKSSGSVETEGVENDDSLKGDDEIEVTVGIVPPRGELVEHLRGRGKRVVRSVIKGVENGEQLVGDVSHRWNGRTFVEEKAPLSWRSDAFDLV